MSSPEHKKLIWNLIKDIKIGMLTTQSTDESASLRARPMSLVQEAYDGTLYFFTSKNASKVDEVKKEKEEVCITFTDHKHATFVSLSGTAELTQDADLINRYWSEGVAAWFPNGKEDEDVAMLAIKIHKGEHWKSDESKLVQLFELAKANVLEETPEIGEHEKFN